jgi:ABC-type transporter Mla subunit MlaD
MMENGHDWVIAFVISGLVLIALFWVAFFLAWWASGQRPDG